MEEAIAKAGALIEAMEYIRQFRNKIVVVKLGGSVLEDSGLQKKPCAGIQKPDNSKMKLEEVLINRG